MSELERLIKRGEALLERVEALLAPASSPVDWKASVAFRWRASGRRGMSGTNATAGWLQPVGSGGDEVRVQPSGPLAPPG